VGVSIARVLIAGFGLVLMLGGIGVAALGGGGDDLFGALFLFVPGVVLIVAASLERLRYRSLSAERSGDGHGPGGGETALPDARFRPTEERFVDPTSHVLMRVYVDPATGERRYVAEG
jgi:hypothetical protein